MTSSREEKYVLQGCFQRDVTGVEIELKISVLKNNTTGKIFLKFKGTPSQAEHKTGFSLFTTIEMNLPVKLTNPAND
jgi:hypothetical protein